MKNYFLSFFFLLTSAIVFAVPAKKGIWKTLQLNGTPVRAQLMGDENMHYWLTDDGLQLTEQDGVFVMADMEQLRLSSRQRMQRSAARRQSRARHHEIGDFTHYTGQKKGLIILVEFSNMKFQESNDSLLFTRICNEAGYSEGHFRGSVYDYFKAQSYGEFELTFDVVGPVQMDTTYQYYGKDVGGPGYDAHPGDMVATACQAIDHLVDFHDYDWDGDGEVDQVMCIYAGLGQANGGSATTIWPHEWVLTESDYGQTLTLDDVTINTYAVANERTTSGIQGIGTICHEFSHCLGLPDMYDTSEDGSNFGMGQWSIMDQGSYNGNSFCPSGYSSFDKISCGWVMPIELTANQTISDMKPLEDTPEVYKVSNDAYPDEYFLLENRQRKGWDAELPGSGMLILYVDYDRDIWYYNMVNTFNSSTVGGYPLNDHQRCTPFLAGGQSSTHWHNSFSDPYPYEGNDSLTNTSTPAAKLYHPNTDGQMLMNKGILNIARHDNGNMSFRFRNTPEEVFLPEGTVFYESFDNCRGTGGNDDVWSTTMASSNFQPDHKEWSTVKPYGGWHCARFGNASTSGRATTPAFELSSGIGQLCFKAAGWNTDGTTLTLTIEGDGRISPPAVTMDNFAWNDYSVNIYGRGPLRVTFSPEKRFLLDEVIVINADADSTDAIIDTRRAPSIPARVLPAYYTLDGRHAGHDLQQLPRGMYILRSAEERLGRKIVK